MTIADTLSHLPAGLPKTREDLHRWVGQRGAEAPTGDAPVIDRAYVEGLVRLSLDGLERMYDPVTEALYSFDYGTGGAMRVEHLGLRYTVMSALGIHEAKAAGFETSLDAGRLLTSGLEQFASEDIDHLAMGLWAECTIDTGVADALVARLLMALEGSQDKTIGRVLAWALTALALYIEREGIDSKTTIRARHAADRLRDLGVRRAWQEQGGLFCHVVGGGRFSRTMSLFSTQIYWVYALATYGRVFKDAEALRIATRCADTVIRLRDPFHGYAWRFDAAKGRVTERYPVYAVHQDAMAPMAFHVLGDATGKRYSEVNREGLAWLERNELGLKMVDREQACIYRAIRRRFPFNRASMKIGRATAMAGKASPMAGQPWFLKLNDTCRPYHLGWVLHAWAQRLDQVEG